MQDLHHQYHSAKSPRPTWPQPFCVDPEASSKIGFHPDTLCMYIYIYNVQKRRIMNSYLLATGTLICTVLYFPDTFFFWNCLANTCIQASHCVSHVVPPRSTTFHLWICPTLAQLPHGHELTWSTSAPRARRVEMKLCFSGGVRDLLSSLMFFEQSLLDAFGLNVLFTKWSNSRSCVIAEPCAAFPVWMPQALTYNQRLEQRPQLQRIKWERPSPSSMW